MRRLRYGVAMSLDGYIAGPNGEADWILMDPDIDFSTIFDEFDTLIMGSKTYLATQAMGGGPSSNQQVIVVSRKMKPDDYPGITIISDGLAEKIEALKRAPGKDLWLFGGGELFRNLLDMGIVDGIEVAVIPVVLGQGVPFIASPAAQTKLKLVKHRVYEKTGTVSLEYEVVGNT